MLCIFFSVAILVQTLIRSMQARTIPFIENKFPSFFVYRAFTIQVALSDRRENISDNRRVRIIKLLGYEFA